MVKQKNNCENSRLSTEIFTQNSKPLIVSRNVVKLFVYRGEHLWPTEKQRKNTVERGPINSPQIQLVSYANSSQIPTRSPIYNIAVCVVLGDSGIVICCI